MKKYSLLANILFCCLSTLCVLHSQLALAQDDPGSDFLLLSPFPGTVVIAKTPVISFRSIQSLLAEGLLILLDDDDITALVSNANGVYSYSPMTPLAAGEHTLYILGYFENGEPFEKALFFSSRHSETFEEIYSTNRISTTFKTILKRDSSTSDDYNSNSDTDSPYTTFDNYFSTDSAAREGRWETSLRANARYFDQNAALLEPEKKGLSLIDFLITANYTGETYSALTEIGDTTIEESHNTIDYLTRRGGKASVTFGNVTISGFGTLSTESGYEIDGLGFGFNSNDHIMGTSAIISFFDKQMSLKAIYIRGGEDGDSFGTWSAADNRKGDVAGVVLKSDFFDQAFITDFELDTVNYDGNTDDDMPEVYDKAYRVHIGGLVEKYDYELSYKYTGPQYDVVGNQSIVKDWAGADFSGGVTYPDHVIRLMMNYSWDNVEGDDFYARIYSITSGLDYQYSGWQRFPVSILFEHNKQNSTDEPVDTDATSLNTSTLTGSISYMEGPWAIEFRSSYSEQNDATETDYDVHLFTFSTIPSYSCAFFTILPSWTLNSSKDLSTDVKTDTNTLTLDIYTSFLKDTITCELGGTYDWTKTDDNSTDMKNTAIYGRINYRLEKLWWLEDPTIALEFHHNLQEDILLESTSRENTLTLALSTSIPYLF